MIAIHRVFYLNLPMECVVCKLSMLHGWQLFNIINFECISDDCKKSKMDTMRFGVSLWLRLFDLCCKHDECVDRPVSITESQMKKLILNIRRFETSLGNDFFGVRKNEKQTKVFRRFS